MFRNMHTYRFEGMYICLCICTCMYVSMYVRIDIYRSINSSVSMDMERAYNHACFIPHICIQLYTSVCKCLCIYTYSYTQRGVCVYITREWAILPLDDGHCVRPSWTSLCGGLHAVEDGRQLATMVIRCKYCRSLGALFVQDLMLWRCARTTSR